MVEKHIEPETIRGAHELNELFYREGRIAPHSARVSDDQPKPKLPLISKGSDPTLAKHFEDKLNGT